MPRHSNAENEFISDVIGLERESVRPGETVDMRALPSPMPLLRVYRLLTRMPAGGEITVLTSEPGTVAEFQAFARMTGHALLDQREERGRYVHVFRRR